jgi:hypothetical protein
MYLCSVTSHPWDGLGALAAPQSAEPAGVEPADEQEREHRGDGQAPEFNPEVDEPEPQRKARGEASSAVPIYRGDKTR